MQGRVSKNVSDVRVATHTAAVSAHVSSDCGPASAPVKFPMRERPVAVQLRSAVHVTTFLHTPTITPMVILPVFALIAQAFLWANSRYADVKNVHSLATVSTLGNALTCEPLRFPPVDQCVHVREDCDPPETFLSISYLETYFCSPPRVRPLAFGGLVLWLFFLFSFIGICASDFFCPNLATIASTLGLNENVAGVTFLAFGNGSPDLFSTFSAMRAGSGSLAIGELLGAASFIVSVVAGSMPLVRPFRVNPGSFIRDVGFFTMSVACILGILIDGEIHAWEALAMVGLYLVYVCVVVGGSWLEARRERLANHEALIRGEYADTPVDLTEPTFEPYHDDDYPSLPTPSVRTRAHSDPAAPSGPDTLNVPSRTRARPSLHIPHDSESRASSASASPLATSRHSSHIHQLPSFSLLGALEFRTVVNSLHGSSTAGTLSMFDAPVSPYAAGHYHRRLSIVSSGSGASSVRRVAATAPPAMDQTDVEEQRDPWDAAFSLQLSERGGGSTNNGPALAPAAEIHRAKSPVPSIHVFSPSNFSNGAGPTEPRKLFVPEDAQVQPQWKLVLRQVMHTLFPSLVDLPSRPWLWKIVAVCSAPAIFALTLTLPVVVNDPKSESSPGERPVTPLLVDYDESDAEDEIIQAHMEAEEHVHDVHFNKWLTAVQCALSPVFCVSVLFSGQKHVALYILAASLCGVSVSTLTAVFANDGKNPAARLARCFIGFGVAMVWIMAIADEVVQVLQASVFLGALTFGHIFGLSDAIIGLTIFAVGNSLADFVANFTVAAFAPVMGISACFGGPMLNMLLGIGLSGSYVISQTGESYKVNLSPTLLVSAIGLLCLLTSTLIIVPLSDFNLTRRWGLMLITGYVIVMCVNVIVEVKKA